MNCFRSFSQIVANILFPRVLVPKGFIIQWFEPADFITELTRLRYPDNLERIAELRRRWFNGVILIANGGAPEGASKKKGFVNYI